LVIPDSAETNGQKERLKNRNYILFIPFHEIFYFRNIVNNNFFNGTYRAGLNIKTGGTLINRGNLVIKRSWINDGIFQIQAPQ